MNSYNNKTSTDRLNMQRGTVDLFAANADSLCTGINLAAMLVVFAIILRNVSFLFVQRTCGSSSCLCEGIGVAKIFALMLAVFGLQACDRYENGQYDAPQYVAKGMETHREYVFAIHPLHNPVRLFEVYSPLIEYLNRNIPGTTFRLEASRNYEEFENKLYSRQIDFAMPNPFQTLNALGRGYRVIAKMGDDSKFTGIILVRRDSGIRKVSDLKGKKVSFPARTALAAGMMPQLYLQTHGLDVNRDIENIYVGSQESSIMSVFLGETAAGATWPLPWERFQQSHPDQAAALEVKWETAPLINNGVVARDDVSAALATQVAQLLDTLHTNAEGRAILARMPLSRFELADDARYRAVGDFLRKFSQNVRPLNTP